MDGCALADGQIDHFSSEVPPRGYMTFQQRYLVYSAYWSKEEVVHNGETVTKRGPIFFYTGNEADVTLYANATGLMWEHAEVLAAGASLATAATHFVVIACCSPRNSAR